MRNDKGKRGMIEVMMAVIGVNIWEKRCKIMG